VNGSARWKADEPRYTEDQIITISTCHKLSREHISTPIHSPIQSLSTIYTCVKVTKTAYALLYDMRWLPCSIASCQSSCPGAFVQYSRKSNEEVVFGEYYPEECSAFPQSNGEQTLMLKGTIARFQN